MKKKENIFEGIFDNITNTDISEFLGQRVNAEDADIAMFNAVEQENIAYYVGEGMPPAEARHKAAQRKKYAMINSGFTKSSK